MADKVYLKRDIKEDKLFEQYPNWVFGMVLVAVALVIVGSVFLMPFVPVPELLLVVDMAVAAAAIIWIIRKNRKSNLSKSEAFVKRDGLLYYIALGYDLNGEDGINPIILAMSGPTTAMNAMHASENMRKSAAVNNMRQHEEAFSALLDLILSAPLHPVPDEAGNTFMVPQLPEFVRTYAPMRNPKLEKQDRDWIWISYDHPFDPSRRVTKQVRNAYDLDMLN